MTKSLFPAIDPVWETRASLEFQTVLQFFALKAQTAEGRKHLLALDLMEASRLSRHFEELSLWFRFLSDVNHLRLPPILPGEAFTREPHKEPLSAAELRDLREMLIFWRDCHRDKNLAFALQTAPPGAELQALTKRLDALFDRNGDWREDISPTFARLIASLRQTDRQLESTLREQIRRHGDALQESIVYERNHRKVLAVKQESRGRVRGILQDYSASGRTVFIEPEETTPLQNRLIQIAAELEEELFRIRVEVTLAVQEQPEIADEIRPRLTRMDLMQALALTGRNAACQPVQPNQEQNLELFEARHPFLDAHFAPHRKVIKELETQDSLEMVPFSLHLDKELRGLVISGANTGGKTVTLKTIGLLAWMANSGLPIPVEEGSHIPFYASILADIGDHQSLSHNLSTYASFLVGMKYALELQDPHTLVLLDELGSGTDPREGNALAQAMMASLLERGLHLIVTTHQQILCTYALNHPNLENGSMSFDPRRLKPTYRLVQGVPGRSHALDIAALIGLPTAVLEQAKALMGDEQMDLQAAIEQLRSQNTELAKQKQKYRREELRMHHKVKELREEAEALRHERDQLRVREKEKLSKMMEKAEKEMRAVINENLETRNPRKAMARFAAVRNELMGDAPVPQILPDLDLPLSETPATAWKVGDKVFLKTWRQEGRIQSIDRKRVQVNCKGKILTAEIGDVWHLAQPEQAEKPRVLDLAETHDEEPLSMDHNLLGFRVEEALLELDNLIDRAFRRNLPLLRIIHGHGSGALKQSVRDFLRRHPGKQQFEVIIDRSNDGVTEIKFGEN